MSHGNFLRPLFLLGVLLVVLPPQGGHGEGQGHARRVLLEIGQEKVTFGDFLLHLQQINPLMDFAKLPPSEQRRWLDEFAAKKLFALRAREAKLDRKPEVGARIQFFIDSVLAQAFKEQVLQEIAVTEGELTAYYETHKEEFKLPARVFLQHFLYRSPLKAARAQERLQKGVPFAPLAEEKKTDSELLLVEREWFTAALLIPELAEVAFRLPVGEVSDVIRSSYGYHVLRVEASEPGRYKDFAAVRSEVLDKVRQTKATRVYQQILDATKSRDEVRLHLDRPQN